jgi:ketosteroid isomerase-like protein
MPASTSNELIHAAREIFNIAIADKDSESIRSLLAPNYHIVTGRSAQNHGAAEEAKRWADLFRDDPTAIYRRTTREITINEGWGIAEELGNWKGSYTAQGTLTTASGVYTAKWQRSINNEWKVQVEVFTTLHCDGACEPPDSI